jgi:hypothetical protein
MTHEWVEVNIVPSSHPERLLLDVVDPLIHDRLRERGAGTAPQDPLEADARRR